MVTRRKVLAWSAAGLVVPTSGLIAAQSTPEASPAASSMASPVASPIATTPERRGWTMPGGNPARSAVMPGPIPSLELPVIVRWTSEPEDDWFDSYELIVVDGTIFARSYEAIYAVNANSGMVRWRAAVDDIHSMMFDNGILYVSTGSGLLRAFNPESGAEIWRFGQQLGDGTPGSGDTAFGYAAVANSVLIVTQGSIVYGLDASTGMQLWQNNNQDENDRIVVLSGEKAIVNSWGTSRALSAITGDELWRSSVGSVFAVAREEVAITTNWGYVSGVDVASGQELWRHTAQGSDFSVLAASDFVVITVDIEYDEYGDNVATINAIDSGTGGLLWMYGLGIVESWPEARMVGGHLYVKLSDPDNLALQIEIATGLKTWEYRGYIADVNPVAVENSLYFVHDDALYCVGNLLDPMLISDVTLRAAPAATGIERGTASAGDPILNVGAQSQTDGEMWVEISVGDVSGWIPASAIDPATLPPEGEPWVIYDPAWFSWLTQ